MANPVAKYFIAIVPPEPLAGELYIIKQKFAEEYNTRAALRSPAHITLHMPFEYREDKEQKIKQTLEHFAKQYHPLFITLKGYGFFEPKVIYLHVEENPFLNSLQQNLVQTIKEELNIFNANYRNRPFVPHLTLAFRDLKKDEFYKAKQSLQNQDIHYQFTCNKIALLKHNGKYWEVTYLLPLCTQEQLP